MMDSDWEDIAIWVLVEPLPSDSDAADPPAWVRVESEAFADGSDSYLAKGLDKPA